MSDRMPGDMQSMSDRMTEEMPEAERLLEDLPDRTQKERQKIC